MFHSVADILGFNEFMRLMLGQAAYAICGMMEKGSEIKKEKPMVAVTAYGISSVCAMNAEPMLEKRGYEMIAFHANGCGGMAMEEFIAQGLLAGVIDVKGLARHDWRQQASSEFLSSSYQEGWITLSLALFIPCQID
jgi:uncharacterized protein (UPF0261 family)